MNGRRGVYGRTARPRVAATNRKRLHQRLLESCDTDRAIPRLPAFKARLIVNRIEIVELGSCSLDEARARAELWLKRHYVLEGGAIDRVAIEAEPLDQAQLVPIETACRPLSAGDRMRCDLCGLEWSAEDPPPPCGAS